MGAQLRERTMETLHASSVAEVMTALGIPATVEADVIVVYTSDGYGGRAAGASSAGSTTRALSSPCGAAPSTIPGG